jgi:hypothetical protein
MHQKNLILPIFLSGLLLISWNSFNNNWTKKKHPGYSLFFTSTDEMNTPQYQKLVDNGIASVKSFFDGSYTQEFDIYIHSSRHSLDSTWQKEWKMPEFKSECWMVASGVSTRLDMISPKLWDSQACEHVYSETIHTQQLITHELVHVYHGQLNVSPDFSNTEGIDWFVEGLATYASGQCDSTRIEEVKKAITENKIPESLDNFWTGKIRYALSGSVVMFIDKKFGRAKLKELLPVNNKQAILSILKTTESELLNGWKIYIRNNFNKPTKK